MRCFRIASSVVLPFAKERISILRIGALSVNPLFEKNLLILQVIYKTPGERGVGGSFMKNYRSTVRSRTMKAIYPPLRG